MRKISAMTGFVAAAMTAVLGLGAPATAAVNPPTAAQLKKGLLVQTEAPRGYKLFALAKDTTKAPFPVSGGLCDDTSGNGPTVETVGRRFKEGDGTVLSMTISAPGAQHAQAFVKTIAAPPTQCPKAAGSKTTTRFTRMALPALGGTAAAVVITDHTEGKKAPMRMTIATIARGNLFAMFLQTQPSAEKGFEATDDTEFKAFVAAGAKKLAAVR